MIDDLLCSIEPALNQIDGQNAFHQAIVVRRTLDCIFKQRQLLVEFPSARISRRQIV